MTRQEFSFRYFRWCLVECDRAGDSGFARIRFFPAWAALRLQGCMLRIRAARERAQKALGPRFDAEAEKAFHDVVLGGGRCRSRYSTSRSTLGSRLVGKKHANRENRNGYEARGRLTSNRAL
jgi:hypothetical protein